MKQLLVLKIIIITIFLVASCKKESIQSKYVGNWDFVTNMTEFNTDSIGYFKRDTITYSGSIKYGNSEDEIIIQYTENDALSLKVDGNGTLSGFPTGHSRGEFAAPNKVHIYFQWGGLGGGGYHIADGVKVK